MRKPTKRLRFQEALSAREWAAVGRREWQTLRAELPDISETSLRKWLREAGVRVEQPYRGVETSSMSEFEASLTALTELYASDAEMRRACRATVIAAKDRAKFAARNLKVDESKRAEREEMVSWMLVWLSDPAMFPTWAALRRTQYPIT